MSLTKVKAGNILLTTPSASSNDVTPATTQYVTTALANMVDSAPSTLNTLNELAAALGDDANFSTTVTNNIAAKLPLAGGTLTGDTSITKSGNPIFMVKTTGAGNNPVLRLQADTNKWDLQGTFSNTNDELFFMYNSSTKMAIDNNGNVGIGQSSPSARLDVVTDSVVYAAEFTQSKTTNGDGVLIQVGSTAAADYALTVRSDAGNTSVLAAKADGKVGIGTFLPDKKLEVAGTDVVAKFTGTDANPPQIEFENSTGVQATIGLKSGHDFIIDTAGEDVHIGPNASSAGANGLMVAATGNVGIGTTSPATNLHIDGVSNYNGVEIKGAGGSRPMLQWSNANNGDLCAIYGTEGNAMVLTSGSSNKARMVIKSNGALQLNDDTSTSNRKEEVFHYKNVGTSYTDYFSVDLPSAHTAVFYEIITFGADWSSHSAARSYYKGFMSGTTGYSGDNEIENSGAYGAGSHIDWNYTRSGSTVTFQVKVYTGTTGLAAYMRVIGTFGNITLL